MNPNLPLRELLKSKLHHAVITEANVDYVGSVTIDQDLLDAVDLWPGEYVHIWNVTNGERLNTYTIAGERGSGVICLNGPAALRAQVGQKLIIAAFAFSSEPITPKVALLDDRNKITQML
jgi:aspartate 1-decarboxylase